MKVSREYCDTRALTFLVSRRLNSKGASAFRSAYSDRTRKIIENRYAEDIEMFGCRFHE